jgi:uncharacterized protein YbdZ (MbtH family)
MSSVWYASYMRMRQGSYGASALTLLLVATACPSEPSPDNPFGRDAGAAVADVPQEANAERRDTNVDSNADGTAQPACERRGETDCERAQGCYGLYGTTLEAICGEVGGGTVFACVSGGPDGGQAQTWARQSTTGQVAVFTTTQIPNGWQVVEQPGCGVDASADVALACEQRQEGDCGRAQGCYGLYGTTLEAICGEVGGGTVFACVSGGPDGGQAQTWARQSTTGQVAAFTTTQIPNGWQVVSAPPCGMDAAHAL